MVIAKSAARFVSRLTTNTLALVLAGGRGERLGALTDWRTKPAVPFGGKFRIIDFTLSNCLHSGIRKVCILTQYKSHSLIKHIMRGWQYLNTERGDFIDIVPAQQWMEDETWFLGTADAVYQSLDIIEGYGTEHLLILAGDHVYNMDYGEMLAQHVNSRADFTVACLAVPITEAAGQFGIMEVNDNGRVVSFSEKPQSPAPIPGNPSHALASMGIYIAKVEYLEEHLRADAVDAGSSHDFGRDIIPKVLNSGDHVEAHQFVSPLEDREPYWRDVGTIDAYYRANLELISPQPPMDIYDQTWPTLTYQPQLPPAHFVEGNNRGVSNSMVSGGCVVVDSCLQDSILFSNVKVQKDCVLDGVLALPGCEIGPGSRIKRAILDNQCKIPAGTVIGENPDLDVKQYPSSEDGVIVVNRRLLGQGEKYFPGVISQSTNKTD